MLTNARQQIARALTGCCVVLLLTGALSVVQGTVTPQWMGTHCPQGHAQNGQHNHSHCTWHCGGFDIQAGGGRGETSTGSHVGRVWSFGHIPQPDAVLHGEFPPRGPPDILQAL
ncbi:MAG: hypothetical protein KF693_10725 [Nitrospira sp.]|nr:hypothetical protein [Nitrospira sp.]